MPLNNRNSRYESDAFVSSFHSCKYIRPSCFGKLCLRCGNHADIFKYLSKFCFVVCCIASLPEGTSIGVGWEQRVRTQRIDANKAITWETQLLDRRCEVFDARSNWPLQGSSLAQCSLTTAVFSIRADYHNKISMHIPQLLLPADTESFRFGKSGQ